MAKETGRNMALIMLGIVAVIAIVGLIMMYSGAKTAQASRQVYAQTSTGPYQRQFYSSPAEACLRAIHCQDGIGAVLVGVSESDPNVAVCVCPEHYHPTTVFESTALRRGEDPAPLEHTEQHYRKVVWSTQSAFFGNNVRSTYPVYEKPGTYSSDYYRRWRQ